MIPSVRASYNAAFSEEKYQQLIDTIHRDWPDQLEFRIAESPVFIPVSLREKLTTACESFIDTIAAPDFKSKTDAAIPPHQRVPNENAHTHFLAIDFAICQNEAGEYDPQLIELQGFPSLFAFQGYLPELFKSQFPIPESFIWNFGNYSLEEYKQKLKEVILADEEPAHCILLEIFPEKQKTRVDFAVTEAFLGIRSVCYTQIKKEGRTLYYDLDGVKTPIKRIYNRLIFDDLTSYPDLQAEFSFMDDLDVTWVGHPNWFFRISKYTLPLLQSPYVPETHYLSEYQGNFPENLEAYVLKPLFSFAGTGVNLYPTRELLAEITDPENYILQKKVSYQPVIQAPDGLVKCEIRMLYVWPDHATRPELLTSLSRLSRGEMIGVRFNKDFTWVGGTACFFES
ncbi:MULTISPECIES: hypothetical protein [unclassified Siphonobacter]|uniref:hypothetical protein n=1 Tax=unclassified Siphonobacter TaxID=2635712 RepID=UPI000CAD59F0|nr:MULTISPECIES: hypothetical protein [unclassified Siphonobacter]MDQ1088930.1 hypothetical protein [Siphonobacter sp. SORGH_AS_1065]MDR6195111.1 hypothetical protein [Siphonobacter sp. SORGH_AS_0500]PKK38368.1 hypothetical protein BWI96_00880 [Siphonobacter sp. SORGH_AS_0500]